MKKKRTKTTTTQKNASSLLQMDFYSMRWNVCTNTYAFLDHLQNPNYRLNMEFLQTYSRKHSNALIAVTVGMEKMISFIHRQSLHTDSFWSGASATTFIG